MTAKTALTPIMACLSWRVFPPPVGRGQGEGFSSGDAPIFNKVATWVSYKNSRYSPFRKTPHWRAAQVFALRFWWLWYSHVQKNKPPCNLLRDIVNYTLWKQNLLTSCEQIWTCKSASGKHV